MAVWNSIMSCTHLYYLSAWFAIWNLVLPFNFFFWKNWRGQKAPTGNLLIKASFTNKRRVQKRNRSSRNKENQRTRRSYNRFLIHRSKVTANLALALRVIFSSFEKAAFTKPRFWGIPLKIRSFLADQMHQHMRMATTMKKCGWAWFLICWIAEKMLSWAWILMLIWFQQSMAKEHPRNRCSIVSSVASWHMTQFLALPFNYLYSPFE